MEKLIQSIRVTSLCDTDIEHTFSWIQTHSVPIWPYRFQLKGKYKPTELMFTEYKITNTKDQCNGSWRATTSS